MIILFTISESLDKKEIFTKISLIPVIIFNFEIEVSLL